MPNYTVSATSNEPNAWKAFDNKVNTEWVSTESSGQLIFDFGFRATIKGVRFTPALDNVQAFPRTITLEGRSDGEYELIKTFTLEEPEAEVSQPFVFEEPAKYQFYRFDISEGFSGNPGIAEIEFLLPKSLVVPEPILQVKTVTPTTTTQTITADETYQGLSEVTVEAASLQEKTVSPSESSQIILPDSEIYGLSKVTVEAARLTEGSVAPGSSATVLTPPTGILGYSKVSVNAAPLQEKTVTPSTTSQIITPDSGQYGLSKVTVSAATLQEKTVSPSTSSQIITPDSSYYGLSQVTVNAAPSTTPKLQTKTATPSTSSQSITPDSSYDGLSKVTVSAIPSKYVDTSSATATAADIASGKTAYVNGSKVTGTMTGATGLVKVRFALPALTYDGTNKQVCVSYIENGTTMKKVYLQSPSAYNETAYYPSAAGYLTISNVLMTGGMVTEENTGFYFAYAVVPTSTTPANMFTRVSGLAMNMWLVTIPLNSTTMNDGIVLNLTYQTLSSDM